MTALPDPLPDLCDEDVVLEVDVEELRALVMALKWWEALYGDRREDEVLH